MVYSSKYSCETIEISDDKIKDLQGVVRGRKVDALYAILERERITASKRLMDVAESDGRLRYYQGMLKMWEVIVGELTYLNSEGFEKIQKDMEEKAKDDSNAEDEYDEGDVNYANMV